MKFPPPQEKKFIDSLKYLILKPFLFGFIAVVKVPIRTDKYFSTKENHRKSSPGNTKLSFHKMYFRLQLLAVCLILNCPSLILIA